MSKVCRIINSENINKSKYVQLHAQAKLLGKLRKEIWHQFGSINGVGRNHREIRDNWVQTKDFKPLAAKAWKETLRDTLDDIKLYEESAKQKVRKAINARYKNTEEAKKLYNLLKCDNWVNNKFLNRLMRKFKKHGKTSVDNQIIVENGVYKQFQGLNGKTWLKIPSLERGKMVCIPLSSNIKLQGCLRIILTNNNVQVHYAIEQKKFQPCGDLIIGIDKGYSEAYADSEGKFYGNQLGIFLTKETENRNKKGIARNKLYQIALAKPKKAKNIYKFNLGKIKQATNNTRKKETLRGIIFEATHRLVDTAKEIRAEDLTSVIKSKSHFKKLNRLMSNWTKGFLAQALNSVTKARSSCLRLVNAAYTSQMDSNTHQLEGRRVGDKFYHVNGEVSHADTNAAVNIKHRAEDTEIGLYTPFKVVKKILLDRLTANGGVSNVNYDRPSMTPVAHEKSTSTESELLENYMHNFA